MKKKELTLKELQDFGLKILTDVDRFCREHSIKYSLAYGTFIGAVRHKGFIPWDDDIDIIMKREDYDLFKSTYTSPHFKFYDLSNTPDCYVSFGRVCDTELTEVHSLIPWHGPSCETGVWIDVFPLDKVDGNPEHFFPLAEGLEHFYRANNEVRKLRLEKSELEYFPFKHRIKYAYRRKMHPRLIKLDPHSIALTIEECAKLSNLKPGNNHYSQLTCIDKPDLFEASWVENYSDFEFEGHKFMGWTEYDKVLSMMYGDYMSLPPVEQRVPQQSSYIRFCWK